MTVTTLSSVTRHEVLVGDADLIPLILRTHSFRVRAQVLKVGGLRVQVVVGRIEITRHAPDVGAQLSDCARDARDVGRDVACVRVFPILDATRRASSRRAARCSAFTFHSPDIWKMTTFESPRT